ncbi:hypothetical protein D1007_25619 [Hordeum vulgare]|nr:hypothetical protein D1007_25619 [Hordeum vulgare]
MSRSLPGFSPLKLVTLTVGRRRIRAERRATRVVRPAQAGRDALRRSATPSADDHTGRSSNEHRGLTPSPTTWHALVAPTPPRTDMSLSWWHMSSGADTPPAATTSAGTDALLGATPPELLEERDLATLGRHRPPSPGVLHGTRTEYRRPDYINPWGRAQFDDDCADTRPGKGVSNTEHHCGRRHARDPAGSPRANRYEQHRGGGPQGWLCGDAQRGCPRGAHLLAGSCFGQTSWSQDQGPLAWDRVDAPLCLG